MNYLRINTRSGTFYQVHEKHHQELLEACKGDGGIMDRPIGLWKFEDPWSTPENPSYTSLFGIEIESFFLSTLEIREGGREWEEELNGVFGTGWE